MSTKKPTDEKVSNIPPFGLRMMPDLKERISHAAEASGRSMNAEIVERLEGSFRKPSSLLSELVQTFSENLSREPGVTEHDINALWATYNEYRAIEWNNIKSFMEATGEIIQRASGRENPVGQTDFITNNRKNSNK